MAQHQCPSTKTGWLSYCKCAVSDGGYYYGTNAETGRYHNKICPWTAKGNTTTKLHYEMGAGRRSAQSVSGLKKRGVGPRRGRKDDRHSELSGCGDMQPWFDIIKAIGLCNWKKARGTGGC